MITHIGPKGDIRWRLPRATAVSKAAGWVAVGWNGWLRRNP